MGGDGEYPRPREVIPQGSVEPFHGFLIVHPFWFLGDPVSAATSTALDRDGDVRHLDALRNEFFPGSFQRSIGDHLGDGLFEHGDGKDQRLRQIGMTQEEVSIALDVPLGTIKSRVRRGLIALKELLDS